MKQLDGPEGARALGLCSPVTMWRALALWPVHRVTVAAIRSRLVRTI